MDGDRLAAHYRCWADALGAFTVVIPYDLCFPGSAYGAVHPDEGWFRDWTRRPVAGVFLSQEPNTERGYFAGMHELGHLATQRTPDGRRWRRDWGTRRAEAESWRWAIANAVIEPSPAVWRDITFGLESYLWKTKPDPTFYRLLLEATKKGSEDEE
jgi:hypothetical protein